MSIWRIIAMFLSFGAAVILAHYFTYLLATSRIDETEAVKTALELLSAWLVLSMACLVIVFVIEL